ncbi:hypothetical protein NKH80_28475, partial [Mesorhizobium sp. M0904]|uniref:hypothetical protein n=1 Tax=Mesorhizobium sp. M0904 TaxID=2957022 RepID=UPI00333B2B14
VNRFLFISPSFNRGRTLISDGGNYPWQVTEDTLARDLAALADYLQATGCLCAGLVGSLCTIAIVNAGCAQYPVSGAEF